MLRNIWRKLQQVEGRTISTTQQLPASKQRLAKKYAGATGGGASASASASASAGADAGATGVTMERQPSVYALEEAHIAEAIQVAPELTHIAPELWRRAHATFTNHGLDTVQFLRIATAHPAVLRRPPQQIVNAFEHWRGCQFGEKLLHLLLTKYPELLDVADGRRLLKQVTFLRGYVASSKNVWKLLMNCPSLLEQSEERIQEKINYLGDVMHIETPEIVKSAALARSLVEIRQRHVFLERLGLYTPRPLKADPNTPTTNTRLYQITDTSEKTFATKICHVALAEFEAFKELYARELERQRRTEEADDDDDDDPDNGDDNDDDDDDDDDDDVSDVDDKRKDLA